MKKSEDLFPKERELDKLEDLANEGLIVEQMCRRAQNPI